MPTNESGSGPCGFCGALTKVRCSNCKQTYYCDKNCQSNNWKQHKTSCKQVRTINPAKKRLVFSCRAKPEAALRTAFVLFFHCFQIFPIFVFFYVLNWFKLVHIATYMSKMDQTCPKWLKLVQNGSNLSKLDQNCLNEIKLIQVGPNLSKLKHSCPKWYDFVQNGRNLSKMDQTCPDWIKFVLNGSNLSKLDNTCPKWIKLVHT